MDAGSFDLADWFGRARFVFAVEDYAEDFGTGALFCFTFRTWFSGGFAGGDVCLFDEIRYTARFSEYDFQ